MEHMWVLKPQPGCQHPSVRASKHYHRDIISISIGVFDILLDLLDEEDIVEHGLLSSEEFEVLSVIGLGSKGQ